MTIKRVLVAILMTVMYFMMAAAIWRIPDGEAAPAAPDPSAAVIDHAYANSIVDAIWHIEGGSKTKYPFGIMSVKCAGYDECRKVSMNTVRNNWKRWQKAGRPGEYLDFLANKYCPIEHDPVGNANWKKNIRKVMK